MKKIKFETLECILLHYEINFEIDEMLSKTKGSIFDCDYVAYENYKLKEDIKKSIVTDKMIIDFIDCFCIPNPYDDYCLITSIESSKEFLKLKGYNIEE
jgi:hypothetical protein